MLSETTQDAGAPGAADELAEYLPIVATASRAVHSQSAITHIRGSDQLMIFALDIADPQLRYPGDNLAS